MPCQVNTGELQEIVVHVQRRQESPQKVAITIQPITSADLDSRKVTDLTQLTIAMLVSRRTRGIATNRY